MERGSYAGLVSVAGFCDDSLQCRLQRSDDKRESRADTLQFCHGSVIENGISGRGLLQGMLDADRKPQRGDDHE